MSGRLMYDSVQCKIKRIVDPHFPIKLPMRVYWRSEADARATQNPQSKLDPRKQKDKFFYSKFPKKI